MHTEIEQCIERCTNFFQISAQVKHTDFVNYRLIGREDRGVYIIYNNISKEVIYVGKGDIANRQQKHWIKSVPNPRNIYMPQGWQWLRENYPVSPVSWSLYYLCLNSETELSAMEGALIHFLQPLANDETHHDRKKMVSV